MKIANDDDGTPSEDVHADLLRVLALVEDERHLVAYDLYRDARNRVELSEASSGAMEEARKYGVLNSLDHSPNYHRLRVDVGGEQAHDVEPWAYPSSPSFQRQRKFPTRANEGAPDSLIFQDLGSTEMTRPSISGQRCMSMSMSMPHWAVANQTQEIGKKPGGAFSRTGLLTRQMSCPGSPSVGKLGFSISDTTREFIDDSGMRPFSERPMLRKLVESVERTPGLSPASSQGDLGVNEEHQLQSSSNALGGGGGSLLASQLHTITKLPQVIGDASGPKLISSAAKKFSVRHFRMQKQLDDQARCVENARKLLDLKRDEFFSLEKRALLFQKAKENLTVDDDWTFAQTLFGVTTHYRRETDGTLSVKIEGGLAGVPLFEQMAVLRECDLYSLWSPFCIESEKLSQLGKIEVVGWLKCTVPVLGLTRDTAYRAMGCDTMREDGSIMLVAEGFSPSTSDEGAESGTEAVGRGDKGMKKMLSPRIKAPKICRRGRYKGTYRALEMWSAGDCQRAEDQSSSESSKSSTNTAVEMSEGQPRLMKDQSIASMSSLKDCLLADVEIPPVPTKFGSARMVIRNFNAVIDVLAADSARTRIVANIDPNLKYMPQSWIDFFTTRICGIILLRIQATARKIIQDPVKSPHARRIREDSEFYRDWLLPKFKAYCDELGWEVPPVSALEVEDDESDEGTSSDETSDENSSGQLSVSPLNRVAQPFREVRRKIDEGPEFLTPIKSQEAKVAIAERKIEASRRKLKKQLRPAPLGAEQRRRYEELQRTKRRLEEEKLAADEQYKSAMAKRSELRKTSFEEGDENGFEIKSYWATLEFRNASRNLKRRTRSVLRSPMWSVLGKLVVMFFVFFSNGPAARHASYELNGWLGILAATLLMATYVALHAYVVYSVCVWAFDTIEPHVSLGQSNAGSKRRSSIEIASVRVFRSGRVLFQNAARSIALKFSIVLLIVSGLISFATLWHRSYSFNSATTSLDASSNLTCVGDAVHAIARGGLAAAVLVFETMSSASTIGSWESETLEICKWLMANSASFLVSLVFFATIVLKPRHRPSTKKVSRSKKTISWRHGLSDELDGNERDGVAGDDSDSSKLSSSQLIHRHRIMRACNLFTVGNSERTAGGIRGFLRVGGDIQLGGFLRSGSDPHRASRGVFGIGGDGFGVLFRGGVSADSQQRVLETPRRHQDDILTGSSRSDRDTASTDDSSLRNVKSF